MSMTDKERAEIRRHVHDREKLAKAMAAERSAELLAEFERQISAIYKWSDSDVWAEAMSTAKAAVDGAQHAIARECERLGIPSAFQPLPAHTPPEQPPPHDTKLAWYPQVPAEQVPTGA